jgi:hypothetical protein
VICEYHQGLQPHAPQRKAECVAVEIAKDVPPLPAPVLGDNPAAVLNPPKPF